MDYEELGRMLKSLVPKFRSDLSVRLRDIAEKQFLAKLKPIVEYRYRPFILLEARNSVILIFRS